MKKLPISDKDRLHLVHKAVRILRKNARTFDEENAIDAILYAVQEASSILKKRFIKERRKL